MGGG
ncbi:hypothetical protein YPPY15_3534, partial [Yersinia pestis PY-15]|jgi:hypothetical protein